MWKALVLASLMLLASCSGLKPISSPVTVRMYVEVTLVPDASYMPCTSKAIGCASSENKAWVLGYEKDGKIYFNQKVMGHEIQHLMSWSNPKIANPDERQPDIP